MRRYLTVEETIVHLNSGKTIEQCITTEHLNESTIINWLSIYQTKNDGFSVTYYQSYDEGDLNNIDIYGFSLTDTDSFGVTTFFSNAKSAIEYAITTYNCSPLRFVNGGMIQEEYRDFLLKKVV